MKIKKILVTGGAGFIGSAVIRHLINETKHTVINIDKLTYAGNLASLKSVDRSDRYTFKKVDICDQNAIKKVFYKYRPDIVMHLAAESHVDRSIDGPGKFIQTNIMGTYILLEQARAYWSDIKKSTKDKFLFHHISTDEVYGDLDHPDDLKDSPSPYKDNTFLALFNESSPYNPSSPYSASKAASDHLVRSWHRTFGLPTIVTNCSNNYGPYHFPEKLIPLIILNAIKGRDLPIYGKGNQIRDWLYVEDHARALVIAATEGKVGETYNIGGHNEKQNIEVVKTICEILDNILPKNSKYEEQIKFVTDRPGHDKRYAIDASKIENELNWKPVETFESGILKTVKWYVENQDWCNNLLDRNSKS